MMVAGICAGYVVYQMSMSVDIIRKTLVRFMFGSRGIMRDRILGFGSDGD